MHFTVEGCYSYTKYYQSLSFIYNDYQVLLLNEQNVDLTLRQIKFSSGFKDFIKWLFGST